MSVTYFTSSTGTQLQIYAKYRGD